MGSRRKHLPDPHSVVPHRIMRSSYTERELPARRHGARRGPAQNVEEETGNVERTRVIIADDESLIRMDLREMLTNLGYLVVGEVGDGRSAVNLARELRPDIVIMDIKMPDMDGIEAARILTEERVAPVLLLSAYSQQDLVQRAQKAGVAGYLVKPFRESDLTPAIEVALARFSEFRAMERAVDTLQEALETRKAVDRAKGILMDTQGLSETEAFRKIQKMSMNNRKSMRTVADAIILAHQISEQ
jgi:response regulator NasT